MNLIIDIGNTRAKFFVFNKDEIVYENSARQLTVEKIDSILSRFCIKRCIVSAVGTYNQEAKKYLESKIPAITLTNSTPIPITNCYATPQTLGYDRIAVAVAANTLYPNQNVLVIDCGTAITYELVTSKAEYLGGAISPGVNLRYRALNAFTAKLPLLTYSPDYSLIGNSTETCIRAGVQSGVIAEIDSYIVEVQKQFTNLTVLLTGGDAKSFVNKLKNTIFVAQNLLAFGLNRILEFNKP